MLSEFENLNHITIMIKNWIISRLLKRKQILLTSLMIWILLNNLNGNFRIFFSWKFWLIIVLWKFFSKNSRATEAIGIFILIFDEYIFEKVWSITYLLNNLKVFKANLLRLQFQLENNYFQKCEKGVWKRFFEDGCLRFSNLFDHLFSNFIQAVWKLKKDIRNPTLRLSS